MRVGGPGGTSGRPGGQLGEKQEDWGILDTVLCARVCVCVCQMLWEDGMPLIPVE